MSFYFQISEEVAKLLDLKAKLGDEPQKSKFILKCPKVSINFTIGHNF